MRAGGSGAFQGVAQGEGVHDGGEHAHVVAGDPVHAAGLTADAAEQVAAADDYAGLHA